MPPREDESLLDEMRAAIQGDRERAASRTPKPAGPPPAPDPRAAPEPKQEQAPLLRRLLRR